MIDIIIVNWNSSYLLKNCVDSIINTAGGELVNKIFIVDNNSTDGSLDLLPINDRLEIIKNTTNNGFAKAANQGFKKSTATYSLLLNPDTKILKNTLFESASFMNENPEIDILGIQLLNQNGNVTYTCSRFPSPSALFFDSVGLSKIFPKIFKPSIIMTDWDHLTSRPVDQVMGAYLFIRRSLFSSLGYLDEDFFVYFEDLDFSKRLAETGKRSFFNSEIKAIHIGAGTTSKVKAFRLALLLESRIKYSKKHFNKIGQFLTFIITYFIEPISRPIYFFTLGKFSDAVEVLRGYKMLFARKYTRGKE